MARLRRDRDRVALRALCACAPAWAMLALAGCQAWQPFQYAPPGLVLAPPLVAPQTSPLFVPSMDRDFVWDQVVDVVDDYFRIQREERVRLVDNMLIEGRLDTYPRTGSTIFEPRNNDTVTPYERWESTLQSIRRIATVRVIPAQGGFLVEVQVHKELEDVPKPETGAVSLANAQTLRNDDALIRLTNPVGGRKPTIGWIELGNDPALEQVILAGVQARLGGTIAAPGPAHF